MSTRTAGPTFFPPLGPAKMAGGITPTGWDRCVIAGQVLPALCSVMHGGIRLKIDRKPKSGADGARQTFHGLDPQPLQLELVTYSDDDREQVASILAPLKPLQDRQPKPVSFDHPSVRDLGITNVVIVGISAWIVVAPGVAKRVIDFDHWQPPKSPKKSATSTPTRAVRNSRREAAQQAAPSNPKPTAQGGVGQPPNFVQL